MFKTMVRLSLVVLAAMAAAYGCSDESESPTAPTTHLDRVKLLEVPACGEDTYLGELSPMLPVWQDSLEAWLPGTSLDDAPAWEDGSVADYLGLLVPVLQQWQGAVNAAVGSALLAAVDDFDPQATTTQDYLASLSSLLIGWETAAETERGVDFLPTMPTLMLDEFAPMLECPGDTTFACADTAGVILEFEATATDDCDDAPIVVCDPPSGTKFRAGTTTVTCTATDAAGNSSTCSFDVTVDVDVEAPSLVCPSDAVVECSMPEGVVFDFEVTATDDCDDAPVVVCEPASGSVFPVGTTTVTCTATDAAGNSSSCSFDVTVDAAEVAIHGATPTPSMLWPPNHKMVDISLDLKVENACDVELECTVLEVTSNEPINGIGDGNTAPDWMIGDDGSLKLRAERSGTGSDRVYTVRLRCEHPESGIGDETTVEVVVPHDRGSVD